MGRKAPVRQAVETPVASVDRVMRFAGLGATLIGALLLCGLVVFSLRESQRRKDLVPAQGTVSEERSQGFGSELRVVLTIRFTTAAGQVVHVDRRYRVNETRPAKGAAVSVLYEPANPAQAELEGADTLGRALVGAVGVGFLLVGIVVLGRSFAAQRRRVRPGR